MVAMSTICVFSCNRGADQVNDIKISIIEKDFKIQKFNLDVPLLKKNYYPNYFNNSYIKNGFFTYFETKEKKFLSIQDLDNNQSKLKINNVIKTLGHNINNIYAIDPNRFFAVNEEGVGCLFNDKDSILDIYNPSHYIEDSYPNHEIVFLRSYIKVLKDSRINLFLFPFLKNVRNIDGYQQLAKTNINEFLDLQTKFQEDLPFAFKVSIGNNVKEVLPNFHKLYISSKKKKFIPLLSLSKNIYQSQNKSFFTTRFADSVWIYNSNLNKFRVFNPELKKYGVEVSKVLEVRKYGSNEQIDINDLFVTSPRSSRITGFNYLQDLKKYILIIKNKSEKKLSYEKTKAPSLDELSVIIYDDSLNFEKKYILEAGKYASFPYFTSEGFILTTINPSNTNYDPKKYPLVYFKLKN